MAGRCVGGCVREEMELECVMRLRGAWRLVRVGAAGLLRWMSREAGYGECPVGETVSSMCEDGWAAIRPRTSGKLGALPVTKGQQICWS